MINVEITDSRNSRWEVSDKLRVESMICLGLDTRRPARLLKFQRGSALNAVIEVVRGHCITDVHARRIGVGHLSNDFSRICRDK